MLNFSRWSKSFTVSFFLSLQTCELEFGSWSYDVTQLDIGFWVPAESQVPSPYVDFSDYVESNEWYTDGQYERFVNHTSRRMQIRSVKNFRNVSYMHRNGRDRVRCYPTLRYLIRLRRNPSFYVSILVIPCILLSSLTLVLFWLPPESPAKLMLGKEEVGAIFLLNVILFHIFEDHTFSYLMIICPWCFTAFIQQWIFTVFGTALFYVYFRI